MKSLSLEFAQPHTNRSRERAGGRVSRLERKASKNRPIPPTGRPTHPPTHSQSWWEQERKAKSHLKISRLSRVLLCHARTTARCVHLVLTALPGFHSNGVRTMSLLKKKTICRLAYVCCCLNTSRTQCRLADFLHCAPAQSTFYLSYCFVDCMEPRGGVNLFEACISRRRRQH